MRSKDTTITWTPERIALLRKLWAEDSLTARQIGVRLGNLSRGAVIGKADRLGLKAKKASHRPFKRDMRDMTREELLMLIRTPFPVIDNRIHAKSS